MSECNFVHYFLLFILNRLSLRFCHRLMGYLVMNFHRNAPGTQRHVPVVLKSGVFFGFRFVAMCINCEGLFIAACFWKFVLDFEDYVPAF
ncbi:ORF R U9 [Macacine gammaherpesvirus 5]|nr:ORF R U9 [Macacine gammaherpesvirus 5]